MSIYRTGNPQAKTAPRASLWRRFRALLRGTFHKLENRRLGFGWVYRSGRHDHYHAGRWWRYPD